MKNATLSRTLGLVALALIGSSLAMAQDSGWYIGGNIGRSKATIDNHKITDSLFDSGFSTTSIQDNDHDTGYKAFAGYQFNRYLALESGYFNLGKLDFTAYTLPGGTLNGALKTQGLNLDVVGFLPITRKFSAFARAGVTRAKTSDSFSGTGAVNVLNPDPSDKRAWNAKAGVGLQYQINETFGLRAELERYRITDAINIRGDIDLASAGLVIRFGRRAAAAPTPSPAPVAAQPPPPPAPVAAQPVLVVVPVPTETQEYCSILDLEFTIDSDQIQREDKEKLAVVGTFLNKYPDATAVIEGHSDNVGGAQHNLDLSQRRAQSVVDYLVGILHIAPSRLKAVGYGESRPIADNSTEEGKRQNRRIDAVIACVTDVEGLTVKPARATMALFIDYDKNQADVKPQYDADLRKVANFLKANPTATATVEGHTGNLQGTPEKAMEISQLRAQNVVNYLADHFGIDRSRLAARGFGQGRRFAYNTSAEGQQENRRINIIINYPKQ
jgi:OOP family OmpA-OmpF porin